VGSFFSYRTVFTHITRPSAREKQYKLRSVPFAFSAQVRNTRSPHTIGLLFPGDGSGAFHLMFLSIPQFTGALLSSEIPLRFGPRKNGQLSAPANPPITKTVSAMMYART
jgi:hypothetical protein